MILIVLIIFLIGTCFVEFHIKKKYVGGRVDIPIDTRHALKYISDAVAAPKPTLFYEELQYEYPYKDYGIFKHNCHFGQRKLLLNEIQFLTYAGEGPHIVVYVGAAPCEHLTVIQKMFPGNKYLLIDPNFCIIDAHTTYVYQNPDVISENSMRIINTYERGDPHQRRGVNNLREMTFLKQSESYNALNFKQNRNQMLDIKHQFMSGDSNLLELILSSDETTFIIQDYMSIELAQTLGSGPESSSLLLISDLRTNLWSNSGPIDMDIFFNDCLQIAVLDIMKPALSMLKFHPPYFAPEWRRYSKEFGPDHPLFDSINEPIKYASRLTGMDLMKEHLEKRHYNYKARNIALQPWAPTSSSEARLIISQETIRLRNFEIYDSNSWENRFFIVRYQRMYSYFNTFEEFHKLGLGYDGCLDCFIELAIICQYIERTSANISAFIPSKSQQKNMSTRVREVAELINHNLRYDLHKKTNKSCKLHGHMFRHSWNNFFVKVAGKWFTYKKGIIEAPKSYILHAGLKEHHSRIIENLLSTIE